MKYMKEFGIIVTVTFLGEIIKALIPLQIPASIYGLVIMLVLLETKVISLDKVHSAGRFMIEIMPMMFIPAAVGLLESWDVLRDIVLPVIVVTVISTVAVMAVTGRVTQHILRMGRETEE